MAPAVWPQGSWAPPAPRRGCLRTSLCSPPGTSRAARSLCDPTASQFVVPVAHVLVRELRGHVRAPIGDCASRSEKRRGGGSAGGGGPGPGPSVEPGPAGVPSTTAQFENYICIQDNKSCIFLEKPVTCAFQWHLAEPWKGRGRAEPRRARPLPPWGAVQPGAGALGLTRGLWRCVLRGLRHQGQ